MTARMTFSIFSLDHTGVGIKKGMTKCAADFFFFNNKVGGSFKTDTREFRTRFFSKPLVLWPLCFDFFLGFSPAIALRIIFMNLVILVSC